MNASRPSSPVQFFSILVALAACGAAACAEDEGGDEGESGEYRPIIMANWSLPPPTSATPDQYFCADFTLQEDVFVTGFRMIAPSGSHHAVLSMAPSSGEPDHPGYACTARDNLMTFLYAGGVGTDDFVFPEGVGARLRAGQVLRLNVHTFNATDRDLSGTSGVAVTTVKAVESEAEFKSLGPTQFTIPDDPAPFEVTGSCQVKDNLTVLNWWPHMHQLGTHMKIEVSGEVVHDGPFSFTEQVNYPTLRELRPGDEIRVTCTYENDTGREVTFGDSSSDEMCFAGYYRYPLSGDAASYCLDQS